LEKSNKENRDKRIVTPSNIKMRFFILYGLFFLVSDCQPKCIKDLERSKTFRSIDFEQVKCTVGEGFSNDYWCQLRLVE